MYYDLSSTSLNVKVVFLTIALVAFAFIGTIVVWPIVASTMDSQRTDATSESLSCKADASGTCTFNLTSAHAHYDTSGMTVTLNSVNHTATTTVDRATRQTLTVTGLTPLIDYTGTVAYKMVDSGLSSTQGDFLRYAPIAILVGPLLMLGGLGIFILWRWDVGPIIKGLIAMAFVVLGVYLLPTFYNWGARVSGDSSVSGIGGFVGAIGIMPIIVMILIGIVLIGVVFGARRIFRAEI